MIRSAALSAVLLLIPSISGCSSIPKVRVLHDPLTAEEHLQLGLAYETRGKLDLAISEYEAALEKGGKTLGASARLFLGNAHAQKLEYEDARVNYQKALKIEPENGEALNNLGWVYLQQGIRLGEAERLVRKALDQADPGNRAGAVRRAIYLHTLAEIQISRGRFSQALDTLRGAESLVTPENPSLFSQLMESRARAHEALGEADKARQARQKAKLLK